MHDAIHGISINTELQRINLANILRQDPGNGPEMAEAPATISNVVSVDEPDIHPSRTSVTVSLNENRAGGRLSGTDILCKTISTLGSDRGWIRISAKAPDERKVEGWLHKVYANMLASKCSISTPPA